MAASFHQPQQQQHVNSPVTVQKVAAFKDLASSLASQIVDQLTGEFEREVTILYTDLANYRSELARVTELLGQQLGRERQLHEMLETMSSHHTTITSQAQQVAAQQPNSKEIHEMVDRMVGQQSSIINTTLQGMNQAHSVAQSHAAQAKLLQEPMVDAEAEFSRIMQILQSQTGPGPMTSAVPPQLPPRTFPAPQPPRGSQTPPVSPCMGGQVAYRQIPASPSPVRGQAMHVVHGGHMQGPPGALTPPPATVVQTPPHPGTFVNGGPAYA